MLATALVGQTGDGTLNLIRNYQGLASLEYHGPKLDIYLNTGAEYNSRAASFDPILNVPGRVRVAIV